MKQKINQRLDQFGLFLICLIILALNLFIGSNIKEPIFLVQTVTILGTVCYAILKKIIQKEKVILKEKIDVAMLLLWVSTMIPLFLQKQVSVDGSYQFILKYTAVFCFYLLGRNVITTPKRMVIVINTIIVSSLLPMVFGIDKMTINYAKDFLSSIQAVDVTNDRMVSTFGYPNSLAIYLTMTSCLALFSLVKTNKKWIRFGYAIYLVLAIGCIILTRSMAVLGLIAISLFIYFVVLVVQKKVKRNILYGIGGILVGVVLYLTVALQISKPINTQTDSTTYKLRNLEADTNYVLSFDLTLGEKKDPLTQFTIEIVEINRYLAEEVINKIEFIEVDGKKEVTIHTSEDMAYVQINLKNSAKEELILNHLDINGKEYILNYRYIPNSFARIFTTFNGKNKSVWQRLDYYQDAFKIIGQTGLIGTGGNAWRYTYQRVQDYPYYAKECHSYFLELWMSFGLFGILAFLLVIYFTVKRVIHMIQNRKQEPAYWAKLSIVIGIGFILVHSMMDFDLSFLLVLMVTHLGIAMIHQKEEDKEKYTAKRNFSGMEWIILAIILVVGYYQVRYTYANYAGKQITAEQRVELAPFSKTYQYQLIKNLEEQKRKTQDSHEKKTINHELIQRLLVMQKQEPYYVQKDMLDQLATCILDDIEGEATKEQISNITFWYEQVRDHAVSEKVNVSYIKHRADTIVTFASQLEEKTTQKEIFALTNKMYRLIVQEYPHNCTIINDYRKNQLSKGMTKVYLDRYTEFYQEAIKRLSRIQEEK